MRSRFFEFLIASPLVAATALSAPIISEFMASNDRTLRDVDGQYSDWIEIHNPDAAPVNLAGWYLTDDARNLTKWQFPAVTLSPGGYLVVFASDKNRRDPAEELHTNFQLDAGGEYLALVNPDGRTVASQFEPNYPSQLDDVSYGVTQAGAGGAMGYFRVPTPGARNGGIETQMLRERVTFSRASGPFAGTATVTLTGAGSGQKIRYVTVQPGPTGAAIAEPTSAATEYTGAITLNSSVILRATVFSGDDVQRGVTATAHYVRLSNSGTTRVDNFASNLPLLVIDTHGYGPLEKDGLEHPAWLYTFNRPAAGGTSVTAQPSVATPLSINVRGSSSAEFPKKGFTIRLVTQQGNDRDEPLFGLPSFDTWVLVGPWTYDPSYLHNVLIYALSNRLDRWAPRTQLVELFLNTNGGDLSYTDYAGIYILTDALRVDKKRVDIAKLNPRDVSGNAVTGGYLMKFDVPDVQDFSFQTRRNYPGLPSALIVTSPKAADLPQAQRDYITGYVQSFEDALHADAAANWRQRTWTDFADRDSWVDYHILNTLSMNADAFIRSAYMYKDRRGKLMSGPVWDYDRALGGGDPRTYHPEMWAGGNGGTEFWTYGWWGMLARDPEFMQAWIDRWQKLRRRELSTDSVSALIDGFAAQIGSAAAARDAARWPENASRFPNGYQGEVDYLKEFVRRRSAWIDSMFVEPPTLANANGTLTITPRPGTQIAYTTNGTDPRAPGGAVSSAATVSSTPVSLANTLNLQVRTYWTGYTAANLPGSPWSSAIGNPGRLINLSILTNLAAADNFTMGFVVGGAGTTGPKALLARAAGPSLAPLGVSPAHTDPRLEFFVGSTRLRENDNWAGAAAITAAFAQVGAFAFTSPASLDAALYEPAVAPGNNSIVVSGVGNAAGTVIAELYDATPAPTVGSTTPRLINVSVRKHLGEGLTAGFVVGGGSARSVLIRAIGPTLGTAFGVPGVLVDPKVALFDAAGTKLADNDDWGGSAALSTAFSVVGAFALPEGSRDAALLATLPPGNYTVTVSRGGGANGITLVEVYELP
jgi:hypothetical protein